MYVNWVNQLLFGRHAKVPFGQDRLAWVGPLGGLPPLAFKMQPMSKLWDRLRFCSAWQLAIFFSRKTHGARICKCWFFGNKRHDISSHHLKIHLSLKVAFWFNSDVKMFYKKNNIQWRQKTFWLLKRFFGLHTSKNSGKSWRYDCF